MNIRKYLVKINRIFGKFINLPSKEIKAVEKLLRNKTIYVNNYIEIL